MVVELNIQTRGLTRLIRKIDKAPKEIQSDLIKRWNVTVVSFRQLMQDRHLEGGTSKDRLARRSSNLYNNLKHEVKVDGKDTQVSVWFTDIVSDYAPTHEFGDPSRNIPARMNLRKEWKGYRQRFRTDAEQAINKGLR